MLNKKSQSLPTKKLISAILIVIVVAIVIFGVYKLGIIEWFRGLPSFNQTTTHTTTTS